MTAEPRKLPPKAGQAWTVGSALLTLLADTPLAVTGVVSGLVHFTTASGVHLRFPEPVFRAVFDPVPRP